MTVQELRSLLKDQPDDAQVIVLTEDGPIDLALDIRASGVNAKIVYLSQAPEEID